MLDRQPATVEFLDSTKQTFHVSPRAKGGDLFDKVCAFLGLSERDYFSLCFIDNDGNQRWIYNDKRISKQLKGHPWNFLFQVKFYPPEPTTLLEDRTRHLLSLQVRRDISTGKLPATLATHALLGSYVAQSTQGDYQPSSVKYNDFLKSDLAPTPNETLYEKVEELHKQHKGETAAEADLHYLENAKKLSMYGVHLFPAKDGKGTPVQIGVNAHGINVYLDQIRVHRFLWQNIIKIGYRRNVFVIKLKPGELEKNESTIAFKLPGYDGAKRVWKCGVEHHTFFRLIQPEEKTHKGLFHWGSPKFRYQGRTQFQSKMASQIPDSNQPVLSQSIRASQNDKNVAVPVSMSHPLPPIYSKSGTGRDLEWNSSQTISPEKMHTKRVTEAMQNRENNAMLNGAEVFVKTSPSSDIKNKLKDEKEGSKINVSLRESGSSKAPGIGFTSDNISHDDSFAFNQAKERTTDLEKSDGLISDEAKLGKQRALPRELKKEMYDLKNVEGPSAVHSVNVDDSLRHANIEPWQKTTTKHPGTVITSVDNQGNITKKMITMEEVVTCTVEEQTYQIPGASDKNGVSEITETSVIKAVTKSLPPNDNENVAGIQEPTIETLADKIIHETMVPVEEIISDVTRELVSSHTTTQGTRTVETITYETERDGTIETHVEHRVTIHSSDDIDHDAELNQAILEATNMNPDMTVEKIEVKHESQPDSQ